MAEKSTYHVVHNDYGFEADIIVDDDIVRRLESNDEEIRRRTQDYLCVMFREECTKKYGVERTRSIDWVYWDKIHISRPPVSPARHCCDNDNCVMCDTGYHERCRYGCTL